LEKRDVRPNTEELLKICKDKKLKLNYGKHLLSAERQPCVISVTATGKLSNKLCLVAFMVAQDHVTALSDQGTLARTSFLT